MLFSTIFERKLIELSYICSYSPITLLTNAFTSLKHLTNHSVAVNPYVDPRVICLFIERYRIRPEKHKKNKSYNTNDTDIGQPIGENIFTQKVMNQNTMIWGFKFLIYLDELQIQNDKHKNSKFWTYEID